MPIKSWSGKRPPKSRNAIGQTALPGMTSLEPNKKTREEPEYAEQCTLVWWLDALSERCPVFRWVHAIPNGLALTPKTAAKAKKQGVRKGIWDIFVPAARKDDQGNEWHGLYLEMKFGSNNLTPEQEEFGEHLDAEGYLKVAAYNWIDALYHIAEYLGVRDKRIDQVLHVNRKASVKYETPDPLGS